MFARREWIGLILVLGLVHSGLAGERGVSSGMGATEPSTAEQVVPLLDSLDGMESARGRPLEAEAEVIDPTAKDRGGRVVEPAVIAALRWFANHQLSDGSWSFGDTSVTGWQLHALKNAHMSYLQVPPEVIKKTWTFLDSVQANGGATYGYTTPGEGPATTAIGLLGRMYLGWDRDNLALQHGVERVAAWGLSTKGNMYYNYYATQVAYHWGGDVWRKWNAEMGDWLLESQEKDGHEAGSWFFAAGDHGTDRGGRHYTTSLATLMLLQSHREPLPLKREQPKAEFRELK